MSTCVSYIAVLCQLFIGGQGIYAQWFVPFYSRFLRIGGTHIKHQNTPNWLKAKCTKTCTLNKKISISKYAQKMGILQRQSPAVFFSLPCRLTEPIEKPHMCFPGPAGVPADSKSKSDRTQEDANLMVPNTISLSAISNSTSTWKVPFLLVRENRENLLLQIVAILWRFLLVWINTYAPHRMQWSELKVDYWLGILF